MKPTRMQKFIRNELKLSMTKQLIENLLHMVKKFSYIILGFIYSKEN